MYKRLHILAVSCLLSCLIGCSSQLSMKGYVYEAYEGEPLAGVTVTVAGYESAKTSSDGAYTIQNLRDPKHEVTVSGGERYTILTDTILLEQKTNYRDFYLESLHPLGIVEADLNEPYSILYTIQVGNSKDEILQSARIESIPIEQSVHIVGKEKGLDGKEAALEVIKIGLTGWSIDSYGNWNETIDPGYSLSRFDSLYQEEIMIASTFYKDTKSNWTDTEEVSTIEGVPTRLFTVDYKDPESGFSRLMELYLITEGQYKGQIKELHSFHKEKSVLPYICIKVAAYDTIEEILPPTITQ